MQAMRQQQQQQAGLSTGDPHSKDAIIAGAPIGIAGPRMMPPGSPGVAQPVMEGVRQPLQVRVRLNQQKA